MPSQRHRIAAAPVTKRRKGRAKQAKTCSKTSKKPQKHVATKNARKQKKPEIPVSARALSTRTESQSVDYLRMLDAAYRVFFRMSRPKPCDLH
jgi:hypothetical protein